MMLMTVVDSVNHPQGRRFLCFRGRQTRAVRGAFAEDAMREALDGDGLDAGEGEDEFPRG
jgi:hypothetical protein